MRALISVSDKTGIVELAQALHALGVGLANALLTGLPVNAGINWGKAIDIGGYYHPDPVKTAAAMRPSKTFNDALASL